jgi:hypothetical protein
VRPAEEILLLLGRAGVTLERRRVDGEVLLAALPRSSVTPDVATLIRDHKDKLLAQLLREEKRAEAERILRDDTMGLAAKYAKEYGYITLHDPTTGSTVDVPFASAPDWAKDEASERRRLWRAGDRQAYSYTGAEMEERWLSAYPDEPDEGLVDDLPDD